MRAVQFELTGDTTVQVTMSETAGEALLCVLVLPACLVAAHEISLRLTGRSVHIQRAIRLHEAQLRPDNTVERTASVLLSHPGKMLRLDDVLGFQLKLDAIDAKDRTVEVSGKVPRNGVALATAMDDELMFMDGKGQPSETELCETSSGHPPNRQPHSDIAQTAALSLSRFYDDDMDDMFILKTPS